MNWRSFFGGQGPKQLWDKGLGSSFQGTRCEDGIVAHETMFHACKSYSVGLNDVL